MTYLLLTSILANLALAWLFLADRGRERDFWSQQVAEGVRERAQLLNRIQAPDQAVALSIEPDDSPNYVSQFDDFKSEVE